jgi:hypothetical protein
LSAINRIRCRTWPSLPPRLPLVWMLLLYKLSWLGDLTEMDDDVSG